MANSISKLRDLTSAPATAEHQEDFNKAVSDDADDRGVCLILTAQLENELDRAIDHWIDNGDKKLRDELYGGDGPLGTLSRKCAFAAAIGLIGPITRENLRAIRNIRNAFAHAKRPITFDTDEVAAVCGELKTINIYDPPREMAPIDDLTPRKQFETVAAQTMIRLTSYTGFDVQLKDDDGKPELTLKSEPLP
ncbi:hypothetical protein [Tardiphaga sp. 42S5]|uniref:hypothetical protein n=1 Tax=Tardiphaga sp. 42S5 TaxID=1404799 RepID=UPI002A5A493C|nr:hypothetical protein [Tardiphaga sp. 42S5]WPO43927.1 hypothetical protein SFY93_12540 [Tardiphaga sp. 42S5]